MRYPLVKVLLTVSPFCPSFSPQLSVFSHSLSAVSPLSTAFTPNRPLTPLSTAFTQTHRGVPPRQLSARHLSRPSRDVSALSSAVISLARLFASVADPIFSAACSLLFSLLSFFCTRSLCFQHLAASFAKIPGVWVSRTVLRDTWVPNAGLQPSRPSDFRTFRPADTTHSPLCYHAEF